jgi:hypothetical protein
LQIYKLNSNFGEFNESKELLEELNKDFNEINLIRQDPAKFITSCFRAALRRRPS